MNTYRDHPLAFLCGRQSIEGLVRRAEDWRVKGHKAADIDVAVLFDRAASVIMSSRLSFESLRLQISRQDPVDVIADTCRRIPLDFDIAQEANFVGQRLRKEGLDPYGGSVAASLEMAADEIMHLGSCIENVIALSETVGSYDALEAIVLDALDISETDPVPTHEAPRTLM